MKDSRYDKKNQERKIVFNYFICVIIKVNENKVFI